MTSISQYYYRREMYSRRITVDRLSRREADTMNLGRSLDAWSRRLSLLTSGDNDAVAEITENRRGFFKKVAAAVAVGAGGSSILLDSASADCSIKTIIAGSGANARSCASTSCGVVATLVCGDYITNGGIVSGSYACGCSCGSQWQKTSFNGGYTVGYIHASLVKCGDVVSCC